MKEFIKFWQWMKENNYGNYEDFQGKDIDKKLLGFILLFVAEDLFYSQYNVVMKALKFKEFGTFYLDDLN